MSVSGIVLVTGGAGYIGSHLVTQLLAAGRPVRVLDNLTFGGAGLLVHFSNPSFEFLHGDTGCLDDVDQALEGVTSVVHLAAIVGDPACAQAPELAHEVNVRGAQLICDTAIKAGIRRFVFASTCSNYGRMNDPDKIVNEESPLSPVSLYADQKVGFEKYLFENATGGFEPVVLRFATAYGLSGRPRFDLTVNEFTRELTLKRKLQIYGRQFWRPYAHAADLAAACRLALDADSDKVKARAFNVGDTNENFQKETLVRMIVEELGPEHDLIEYVDKEEDPRDYRVDFTRVRETLGFRPTRTVREGIREIARAIRSRMIIDPDNRLYRNV